MEQVERSKKYRTNESPQLELGQVIFYQFNEAYLIYKVMHCMHGSDKTKFSAVRGGARQTFWVVRQSAASKSQEVFQDAAANRGHIAKPLAGNKR